MTTNVELSSKQKKELLETFDKQSKKNLKEQLSYGNKTYLEFIKDIKEVLSYLLKI